MFVQLNHKSLHVYAAIRELVKEIYAALETAIDLNYKQPVQLLTAGELLNNCFAMLSNMPE